MLVCRGAHVEKKVLCDGQGVGYEGRDTVGISLVNLQRKLDGRSRWLFGWMFECWRCHVRIVALVLIVYVLAGLPGIIYLSIYLFLVLLFLRFIVCLFGWLVGLGTTVHAHA